MYYVDTMSRAPVLEPEDTLTILMERYLKICLTLSKEEQVFILQHDDPELIKLRHFSARWVWKEKSRKTKFIQF